MRVPAGADTQHHAAVRQVFVSESEENLGACRLQLKHHFGVAPEHETEFVRRFTNGNARR